ncbi:ParB N-terminal domain-containing protein [Candidatus Saccharibacteria bacterium]|nr:ParB N-terminal domain-containing protein [Candidatus Saccharibacteria bacterium]MBQ6127164.1 ParB N-terminal domain-containing protein [Candidatus Saccharibacteria bacterium]
MQTKEMKLAAIMPYANNAKTHTVRQVEAVAESISRFGAVQPIVVDRDGVIIIGHCRYKAALLLGLETFPVIVASELTPEQARALRIADNRTNESEWDTALLSGELTGLIDTFELTELGFSEADILELTRDITPDKLELEDIGTYAENANRQLPATSIVITYKTQVEDKWLLDKLGVKELGVVAYVSKLKGE